MIRCISFVTVIGHMRQTPKPWMRRRQLAGDASSRTYFRLWNASDDTAILVCYPEADRRQLERDLEVRAWCAAHGLRVPALLDKDLELGRAVFEDLGEADAEQVLTNADAGSKALLAGRALEPLVVLAGLEPSSLPSWNPPLDENRMRWELAGFELWFVQYHRGQAPFPEIVHFLDEVAQTVAAHPRRICHRDYHLNNLFFGCDQDVFVIDYQDILVGPDTYDIVSLVGERGLPRELSAAEIHDLCAAWAKASDAVPGWQDRFRWVRIQRALKVLGTFARLSVSGTDGYRAWLEDLCRDLLLDLEEVSAPVGVMDLLLD